MNKRIIEIKGIKLDASFLKTLKRRFNRLVEKDSSKEITFLFGNCPGGSIEGVFEFVDHIRSKGVPIRTRNKGDTDSAANLLFLAGDNREGTKKCKFSFHSFTTNPRTIRYKHRKKDFAEWEREINLLFIKTFRYIQQRAPGLTIESLEELFDRDDLYLDLEKAIKFGVVTEVKQRK